MQHAHFHLVGGQFLQAARQGFVRTLHVCLDDDRQILRRAFAHVVEHIFQLGSLLLGKAHIAVFALAEQGDLARFFLVCQHQRIFACVGHVRQT